MALEELLEMILGKAFQHLEPGQGVIYLKDEHESFYEAASRSRDPSGSDILFSRSLFREVTEKGMAALVFDVASDERFADAKSMQFAGVRSLVAAPLLGPEDSLGLIALSTKGSSRHFGEGDLELLVSLASVAALKIRNAALAEEAAERRRLESELALARTIQLSLLPDALPEISGYQVAASNEPSRGVSGDYYQVLTRDDGNEIVLMVADVSGKGIGAALLTASLEALSAAPLEDGQEAQVILEKLSRLLDRRTPPEKYATAIMAVLEPATGQLRYANAGHNPGLLVRRSGGVEELSATGPPLGLVPDASYTQGQDFLGEGDTLVLYTDGITEAARPDGEEFELERLKSACVAGRRLDLEALLGAIDGDLKEFAQGVPFADDRTLVALRREMEGDER
jgi:serine phosphatase RsbU (regulator of sigma subunit)